MEYFSLSISRQIIYYNNKTLNGSVFVYSSQYYHLSSVVVIEKHVFSPYTFNIILYTLLIIRNNIKNATEHDVLKVNRKSLEARNYLSIVCVSERRCSSTISLMANTRDVPKCYIYINRITTSRHAYIIIILNGLP